jgi:hypothetical protein
MANHNHKNMEKAMNTIFRRGKNTPGSCGKFIKTVQGNPFGRNLRTRQKQLNLMWLEVGRNWQIVTRGKGTER